MQRVDARAPTTGEIPVGTDPVLVRSRNSRRAAVLLSNPSPITVYIGFGVSVQVGTGFPLPPGAIMGYDGPAEVYAIATGNATVGFVEENQG